MERGKNKTENFKYGVTTPQFIYVMMMYYLLKVAKPENLFGELEKSNFTYGLFDLSNPKKIVSVVSGTNSDNFEFHKTPKDLGIAIANFFREKNKSIDAIAATEKIEAATFPIRIPHTEFTAENAIVYDRFGMRDYMETIKTMTETLKGER